MDAGRQLANAAFPGASHRSLSQIAIPGVVCGYRSGHGRRAVTGVSHPDRKHHRERQPSRGREACYRPMRGRLACSATNSPPPALVPPACTAMAVYNQRHDLMIDHVVVAGIDAPAVRAVPQRFVQGPGREILDHDAQRPAMLAPLQQAPVQPRRIGAARLHRAGHAPVCGAGRLVRAVKCVRAPKLETRSGARPSIQAC